MAKIILLPGGGLYKSRNSGKVVLIPGSGFYKEKEAVAPTGAIMNQIQNNNVGADLYNGTIIS